MTAADLGPVLFAYDGSDLAKLAIEEAGRQLEPGRDAVVVTVWRPYGVGFIPPRDLAFDAAATEEVRSAAEETAALGASLAQAAGFHAEGLAVKETTTWQGIAAIADDRDASLIVLGSHGKSGLTGVFLGSVASDIRRAIRALGKLPAGVSVKLAGQPQTMSTAFGNLGLGMLVSVALVYLLLVVLFQSWIDPLLILLAVPASLSGVLWMLAATGTTLNVESLMGSIMAIGIAASNSLLLVHFANDRRLEDERVGPAEAALFAGRTRLRPVLMTALAMILGMLPMALALGEAGQQNAPLGRAVIGGLVVSTFATLIVIPCAYAVFRKKRPSQAEHDRIVAEADAGTERAR